MLGRQLPKLIENGLNSLNISLDTLGKKHSHKTLALGASFFYQLRFFFGAVFIDSFSRLLSRRFAVSAHHTESGARSRPKR